MLADKASRMAVAESSDLEKTSSDNSDNQGDETKDLMKSAFRIVNSSNRQDKRFVSVYLAQIAKRE